MQNGANFTARPRPGQDSTFSFRTLPVNRSYDNPMKY